MIPVADGSDPAGEVAAWLRLAAIHMSAPAAQMAGEFERRLRQSRPGPGTEFREKRAMLSAKLRCLHAAHYPDLSYLSAAQLIWSDALRYETAGYQRDRAAGLKPEDGKKALLFEILELGAMPSARSIRRFLAE